jgi:hypothetical protein
MTDRGQLHFRRIDGETTCSRMSRWDDLTDLISVLPENHKRYRATKAEGAPKGLQAFVAFSFWGHECHGPYCIYSQNAHKVPYLGIDGIFTLDPVETVPFNDPRNAKRIVFDKMEYFSFYKDIHGNDPLAENCRYIYRGAAGDPYYFYKADPPAKTSIWDLFELASGENACKDFYYVTVRAPHGDPVHMHLRYGSAKSSFSKLLGNSTGPEDTTQLNPWWSVYCAEGVSGCD